MAIFSKASPSAACRLRKSSTLLLVARRMALPARATPASLLSLLHALTFGLLQLLLLLQFMLLLQLLFQPSASADVGK